MTPFEMTFAVFVAAFALDEYTASKEHGWDSKRLNHRRCNVHSYALLAVYIASVRFIIHDASPPLTRIAPADMELVRYGIHCHKCRLLWFAHQRPFVSRS